MSRPSTHSAVLVLRQPFQRMEECVSHATKLSWLEDTVSTDDDLRSLISELKASLLFIGNIKSEDDILNQATIVQQYM